MSRFCLTVIYLLFSFTVLFAQEFYQNRKLVKVWETPEGLNVPESAFYYKKEKVIYVSNIAGMHNVKDTLGFISKLNDKGEFIEKEWVRGLDAPKGIGISKRKLYVTNIDEVVEVDLKTAQILKRYKNPKVVAVNDVAVDAKGNVYVTDTKTNCLFRIGKDSLEVFKQAEEINKVNGGCVYNKQLLFGSNGRLAALDLKTKTIKILADSTGYLDGIVAVGKNKIVTSDWKGKMQLIEIGKNIETLLNTTPLEIYTADLGYIPKQKLLLVPTFYNNKVVAYKLND
ncbi:MAG: ATP-binding protein [Bacteroidota bacterium]